MSTHYNRHDSGTMACSCVSLPSSRRRTGPFKFGLSSIERSIAILRFQPEIGGEASDDSDISSIIQKLLAMFGQSNSNNVGNSAQSGLFNTGSSGINTNATLFDMIDVQA